MLEGRGEGDGDDARPAEDPANDPGDPRADEVIPPPSPGRSVFADSGAGHGAAGAQEVDELEAADDGSWLPPPGARPVLDGAAFGVYEDERPRSRAPLVIGAVLGVATLAVGLLVWRAVNTDADLVLPAEPTTTSTTSAADAAPTMAALERLVPASITTCVPPAQEPVDDPARVVLECPHEGVPASITYVLYGSIDDREQAFDDIVAEFGVPTSGTECALGQPGAHDYIGVRRVGRVVCQSGGGRVDFAWTSDEAPLLIRAGGGGAFADHYQFWADAVERTDAAFPLPAEQALLDVLPEPLRTGCVRDLGLDVDAPGVAAVRCEPADVEPGIVSSVQFAAPETMSAWIDGRRDALHDRVFDQTDDGCTSTGFGQLDVIELPPTTTTTTTTTAPPPEATSSVPPTTQAPTTTTTTSIPEEPPPPPPDAAFMPYDLDGTKGEILCFVNSNGLNALFWTRDDSLVGSIAVSDSTTGARMTDLLAWWESGGHRP